MRPPPPRPTGLAGAEHLPKLVLAPTFVITLFFVYGFILWTTYLSFTKSALHAGDELDGLAPTSGCGPTATGGPRSRTCSSSACSTSASAIVLGLLLAILLDQKIRGEGVLRTIYLYPMALSFIVTGTAWKWLLNPGIGIEKIVRDWGFESFTLDWIVSPTRRSTAS